MSRSQNRAQRIHLKALTVFCTDKMLEYLKPVYARMNKDGTFHDSDRATFADILSAGENVQQIFPLWAEAIHFVRKCVPAEHQEELLFAWEPLWFPAQNIGMTIFGPISE